MRDMIKTVIEVAYNYKLLNLLRNGIGELATVKNNYGNEIKIKLENYYTENPRNEGFFNHSVKRESIGVGFGTKYETYIGDNITQVNIVPDEYGRVSYMLRYMYYTNAQVYESEEEVSFVVKSILKKSFPKYPVGVTVYKDLSIVYDPKYHSKKSGKYVYTGKYIPEIKITFETLEPVHHNNPTYCKNVNGVITVENTDKVIAVLGDKPQVCSNIEEFFDVPVVPEFEVRNNAIVVRTSDDEMTVILQNDERYTIKMWYYTNPDEEEIDYSNDVPTEVIEIAEEFLCEYQEAADISEAYGPLEIRYLIF